MVVTSGVPPGTNTWPCGSAVMRLSGTPFREVSLRPRLPSLSPPVNTSFLIITRSQLPSVLLIGPSTAFSPDTSVGADFWGSWANYTASTDTIPDILTFHLLDTSVSLRSAKVAMDAFRETYGIPELPIVVNEYGSLDNEQVPSGAAWYIGQFERYNVHGLRANWAGGVNGSELHDFLGNLLGKTVNETGEYYYPAMEWPVYHYYATEMRDERVATSSSSDDIFEVFATSGGAVGAIKILAAERPKGNHQTYDITVTGLSAVGISGSVNIQTYRFNGADWREQVGGPDDLGIVAHDVTNDSVIIIHLLLLLCSNMLFPHSFTACLELCA